MAYPSNLAEWLFEQKDRIAFQATEYTWVEDYAPEYSDFGVVLGEGVVGRAIDKDPDLSLTKAIAEAVERATCIHNGLVRSAGVAAHTDRESAFQNARRELIERIAFDFHFSRRLPFKSVKPKTSEAIRAVSDFSKLGMEISFYELIAPMGLKVVCVLVEGKKYSRPFGGIFGFGCNESAATSEIAALFEALRNAAFYTRDLSISDLSIAEFQKINEPEFFDRFRLALNREYLQKIDFLFSQTQTSTGTFPDIILKHNELKKSAEFSEAPIIVVQVTSNYQFAAAADSLPSFMD